MPETISPGQLEDNAPNTEQKNAQGTTTPSPEATSPKPAVNEANKIAEKNQHSYEAVVEEVKSLNIEIDNLSKQKETAINPIEKQKLWDRIHLLEQSKNSWIQKLPRYNSSATPSPETNPANPVINEANKIAENARDTAKASNTATNEPEANKASLSTQQENDRIAAAFVGQKTVEQPPSNLSPTEQALTKSPGPEPIPTDANKPTDQTEKTPEEVEAQMEEQFKNTANEARMKTQIEGTKNLLNWERSNKNAAEKAKVATPTPEATPQTQESWANKDPYQKALEKLSLEYISGNNDAKKYFDAHYSGVAASGYLLDKQGRETNFLPSQITGKAGKGLEEQAKILLVEQSSSKSADPRPINTPSEEAIKPATDTAQTKETVLNDTTEKTATGPEPAPAIPDNKTAEATETPQPTEQTPNERFDTLKQELATTMAEKGVAVVMYRQGNEIRADYTDKNGKAIGLETIRTLFGADIPKVAELVGKTEALAYTNPELFDVRETASERTARLENATIDRLGSSMRAKADQLKPKGLWSTAQQWFNRGKEWVTNIGSSFQTKLDALQRQRSERGTATNFQRFAKNFNLLTPSILRTDRAISNLNREIDQKSQEFIEASDIASGLSEEIRRLKIMEQRLGRMKEIRGLEKRRSNFQKQMNMLRGQLTKLSNNFIAIDQELKQQQALEKQNLEEQLRTKNPERPAYYSQEKEMTDTLAKRAHVGPEISEPAYDNAPDDRTTRPNPSQPPAQTREPYYSQEKEMTDTLSTTTDFDQSQADESAAAVDTSAPAPSIPLGPPAAPDSTPPATSSPEAQTGEAA